MRENARVGEVGRGGDGERVGGGGRARAAWDHGGVRAGVRRVRAGLVALMVVIMGAMTFVAPGVARGARADETGIASEAAELVLKQLAALRAHDFAAAYALVSRELRRSFSRGEFEWMVKRAHPEVASSAYAFVVRTHEAGGYLYVTVKVHGKNGKDAEALYEIVREGDGLKVNAVSSRRDDGVL